MNTNVKNKVVTCIMSVFFLVLSFGAWMKGEDVFSESERRQLASFPELSLENISSGKFMEDFESYTLDQFPFRDKLRTLKAVCTFYVFSQKDNHDVYLTDGYASKLEYPLKEEALLRATGRFEYVYDKYFAGKDIKIYFSVIPDKNDYLAEKGGYLSMDYSALYELVKANMEFARYIDITELLSLEDYYRTDTHWRQEKLLPVAEALADAMGTDIQTEYEVKTLDYPFYGVYYGQSALPLSPEEIYYLNNETLENCVVYDYQNNKYTAVYDMEKAYGKDSYEMFLSGALPLITIENPSAGTGKELILFRDSFGSSIAPLLAEGYAKITLVDIRYIHPDLLGKYIEFKDQDVLFLYSTLVLNNGETIK